MIHAPGKLVLAGEYAVLLPRRRGLAVAVGPGIPGDASLAPGPGPVRLSVPGGTAMGAWEEGHLYFDFETQPIRFARQALVHASSLLGPFHGEVSLGPAGWEAGLPPGVKPGLGGSAASTVATVRAVDEALGAGLGTEGIAALAADAHREAQGGAGSGIDVFTSTYGGAIVFTSTGRGTRMRASPIPWPANLPLRAVFTGEPTLTVPRVQRFRALAEQEPGWVRSWADRSDRAVARAETALRSGDLLGFADALDACRNLLVILGDRMGLPMEGPGLRALRQVAGQAAVTKQSGAGGGDVGLVIARDPAALPAVLAAAQEAGLTPLALTLGAR